MAGVNTMDFQQAATILNSLNSQVTGQTGITPTNISQFVSVAQKTLLAGYDPVMQAISQMVGRTIFSARPYSRKFRGFDVSEQKWGYITRKINYGDMDAEENGEYIESTITEGQSTDMYTVHKMPVAQTNFYGVNIYERSYTVYKNQLDSAFSGPDEFGQFMAGMAQNMSNMIEQDRESFARMTLANYIAGKSSGDVASVIHLLSEYNAELGLDGSEGKEKYDINTIFKPDAFKAFTQWMYARIANLCLLMTERSNQFQINLDGIKINRHTPYQDQRVYLLGGNRFQFEMMALADTFHDNYLKLADTETVSYWQAIDAPSSVSVTPTYLLPNGTLKTADANVALEPVIGVIMDRDAAGMTMMNTWAATTPLNARGGYWNNYFHYTLRSWNDFTEKGIILMLD